MVKKRSAKIARERQLKHYIREVPDWPKSGINFYDISTLLNDAAALDQTVTRLAGFYQPEEVDLVVGTESRGFIFAVPLALKLCAGFVPARKKGKLPASTIKAQYQKEYGLDHLEMHTDAISLGKKVLIVDDLLATGGTILATKQLVEQLGGKVVGFVFLIELVSLNGRAKLKNYRVDSLLKYSD